MGLGIYSLGVSQASSQASQLSPEAFGAVVSICCYISPPTLFTQPTLHSDIEHSESLE